MNFIRYQYWLRSVSPLAMALALCSAASANPVDGNVVAGEATISAPDPSTLTIEQTSDRAIIDWRSFNIDAGETTRFLQPGSDAWTLNRVNNSNAPSVIRGTLEANGNVVIVNPDGIYFGPGSRVDVSRLIATTADIDNKDFMAGVLDFSKPGGWSASIVNEGHISVRDYGLSALVAPAVRNNGLITARLGTVSLGSGNTFTIDPYGDGLIKLAVGDEISGEVIDVATGNTITDLIKNEGVIRADGGTVAMSAATARTAVNSVINNSGVVEANSVGMRGGKIILGAQTSHSKPSSAPEQRVRVSGELRAGSAQANPELVEASRGRIEITGEVILAEEATIDASGLHGGGTVLIGGDYMGGNGDPTFVAWQDIPLEDHEIPTATIVVLDELTTVSADAQESGDGGKVIVWSDQATISGAEISARGGLTGGDGGFIETSGAFLDVKKAADASAQNGVSGTWLLDPISMSIRQVSADQNIIVFPSGVAEDTYVPSGTPSVLDVDTIESALNSDTSVRITNRGITSGSGNGNITIEDDIEKSSGLATTQLLIESFKSIIIENGVDIKSSSGVLYINLFAPEGKVIGNNVGTMGSINDRFVVLGRDGVELHSSDDVPGLFVADVRFPEGPSPLSKVNYSISFDDDVWIDFSHNGSTATIPTDGWRFLSSSPTGFAGIDFSGSDLYLALENYAIRDEVPGNNWGFAVAPDRLEGSIPGVSALDGVPEIVARNYQGAITAPTNSAPSGLVPVLEVESPLGINAFGATVCNGIYCVPTGLGGAELIDAFLLGGKDLTSTILNPEFLKKANQGQFAQFSWQSLVSGLPNHGGLWDGSLSPSQAAERALTYARLSDAIYYNRSRVDGWRRVDTWRDVLRDIYAPSNFVESAMMNIAITAISASGFNAAIYERNGEIALVFEGSENPINILTADSPLDRTLIAADVVMDWLVTNRTQATLGNRTAFSQYDVAGMIADFVYGKYGSGQSNIVVTGHSLGGGLAQYAGIQNSQLNVVTFNSAGLNTINNRLSRVRVSSSGSADNIVNIRLDEDIVSKVGTQLGATQYSYRSGLNPVGAHSMGSMIATLEGQN